jgi:hypothetical protein
MPGRKCGEGKRGGDEQQEDHTDQPTCFASASILAAS